jgi:hypothetical protein
MEHIFKTLYTRWTRDVAIRVIIEEGPLDDEPDAWASTWYEYAYESEVLLVEQSAEARTRVDLLYNLLEEMAMDYVAKTDFKLNGNEELEFLDYFRDVVGGEEEVDMQRAWNAVDYY